MNSDIKKEIIVKKDKDEIIIFWCDMKANFGNICSNQLISENNLFSGSEASLEYFQSCKKASKPECDMAIKTIKHLYNEDYIARQKLSDKIKNQIWR